MLLSIGWHTLLGSYPTRYVANLYLPTTFLLQLWLFLTLALRLVQFQSIPISEIPQTILHFEQKFRTVFGTFHKQVSSDGCKIHPHLSRQPLYGGKGNVFRSVLTNKLCTSEKKKQRASLGLLVDHVEESSSRAKGKNLNNIVEKIFILSKPLVSHLNEELFQLSKASSGLGFLGCCYKMKDCQDTKQTARNSLLFLEHLTQSSTRFRAILKRFRPVEDRVVSYAIFSSTFCSKMMYGSITCCKKERTILSSSPNQISPKSRFFLSFNDTIWYCFTVALPVWHWRSS